MTPFGKKKDSALTYIKIKEIPLNCIKIPNNSILLDMKMHTIYRSHKEKKEFGVVFKGRIISQCLKADAFLMEQFDFNCNFLIPLKMYIHTYALWKGSIAHSRGHNRVNTHGDKIMTKKFIWLVLNKIGKNESSKKLSLSTN